MARSKWTTTWILGGGSALAFATVVIMMGDGRHAKPTTAPIVEATEIVEAPAAPEVESSPAPVERAPSSPQIAAAAPATEVSSPAWGNLPPPKPILPGEEPKSTTPPRVTSLPSDTKLAKTEQILALVKARAAEVQSDASDSAEKRALLVRLGKQIDGMTAEIADYRVAIAQGTSEGDAP